MKKDKETFYYRGSKLKDGYIRSSLLVKAPKTAKTKRDRILFEIQGADGKLTAMAITPEEAIIISNALLCAWTEWDCEQYNRRYKKRRLSQMNHKTK